MLFLDIWPDASQIFGLLTTLFWVWMLIDCIRNNRLTHKGLWVLFILFTHGLGALVYFFTRGPWLWIYQWAQRPAPIYQSPPPAPKPARESFPSYEQGYQSQAQTEHQDPVRSFGEQQYKQPSYSPSSLQPQYEEPQITYPEEPPLQQH